MQKLRSYAPAALVASALLLSLAASGGIFYTGCLAPLALLGLCLVFRLFTPACTELPVLIFCVNCVLASLNRSSVGVQDSFHESFKLLLLISAFCAVRAVQQKNFISILLFSTAVLAAVGGLLAYGGLPLAEFVLTDGGVLRLQSFFKYANTAACFLGCGYYAALSLVEKAETPGRVRLITVGAGAVLLALYLTASKAVIPLFWVIGTVAWRKNGARLAFFIKQSFAVLPFAAVTLFLGTKGQTPLLLLPILAALAASLAVSTKTNGLRTLRTVWLSCAGIGVIGGLALLFVRPNVFATAFQRVSYSVDALPLLGKHVLFGCGAGAWRYLQYSVRSQAYDVGYLHNGPLEIAIENGLLLFGILTVGLIVCVTRALRQKNTELLPTVALLVIHSFFDIDLSFGCMMIVCGLCVGSLAAPTEEELPLRPSPLLKGGLFLLLSAGMLLPSFFGYRERTLTASFEEVYRSGSREQALSAAQDLESAFPRFAEPVYYEASIRRSMGTSDEEVTRLLERAAALAPYDTTKYEAYMVYAVNAENLDTLCEAYLRRAPRRRKTYDYIRDFLYYAEQNGVLSDEQLAAKQKHYHELYRAAYSITTPIIRLQNAGYNEFVSVTLIGETEYLPLRRVLEVYGFLVSYAPNEQRIEAERDGESLVMYIGQTKAVRDGKELALSHGVVDRDGVALMAVEDMERLLGIVFE